MKLVIGNKNYSSWSLRPWLLLKHFGIDFEEVMLLLDKASFQRQITPWSPAGRVPVLVDGTLCVWDSLAIAEYINETFLDGHAWPAPSRDRARARSLVAEMHAGFNALRTEMPMNVRRPPSGLTLSRAAQADIDRVQQIWSECLAGHAGPWLFDRFSIADAFFAPIAFRFRSYAIRLSSLPSAYQERMLSHPAMLEWSRDAAIEADTLSSEER